MRNGLLASPAVGWNTAEALYFGYVGALDDAAYYISALSADDVAAAYAAPLGYCP